MRKTLLAAAAMLAVTTTAKADFVYTSYDVNGVAQTISGPAGELSLDPGLITFHTAAGDVETLCADPTTLLLPSGSYVAGDAALPAKFFGNSPLDNRPLVVDIEKLFGILLSSSKWTATEYAGFQVALWEFVDGKSIKAGDAATRKAADHVLDEVASYGGPLADLTAFTSPPGTPVNQIQIDGAMPVSMTEPAVGPAVLALGLLGLIALRRRRVA